MATAWSNMFKNRQDVNSPAPWYACTWRLLGNMILFFYGFPWLPWPGTIRFSNSFWKDISGARGNKYRYTEGLLTNFLTELFGGICVTIAKQFLILPTRAFSALLLFSTTSIRVEFFMPVSHKNIFIRHSVFGYSVSIMQKKWCAMINVRNVLKNERNNMKHK